MCRSASGLAEGAVLVLATVLRLVGIGFSPRTPWGRPDEEIFAAAALRLFAEPSPHSAEMGWPELWFRAHHVMQEFLRALWHAEHGAEPNLGCVLTMAPARLLVPMRLVTAALGVATVFLVMRLARRVGPCSLGAEERRAVSIVAGLFYAVNVLAMRDAHFAVSDTVLVLFLTWLLLAVARGLENGWWPDFLSAGVALGLAIGTKWTGLAFGVVPVVALVHRFRRLGPTSTNLAAILLGVLGMLAAFLATNATLLSGAKPFVDGFGPHVLRYDPNAPREYTIYTEPPVERGLTRHLRVSLPFALGWPLTVVALGGTMACLTTWARRGGAATFLVGFWTVFFHVVVTGWTTIYFARYSLPIHPTLTIAAALVVVVGARWLAERLPGAAPLLGGPVRARYTKGAAVIVVLLALEPTLRSIEFVSIMAGPETRERALDWLEANVGEAPVDVSGGYARLHGVAPGIAAQCMKALPRGFAPWVMRLGSVPDPTYLVTDRPATWTRLAEETITAPLNRPQGRRSSGWLVVADPFLPCGQAVSRFGAHDPPACYTEVQRFVPANIACDAMWDDQDHFFAPLWGFRHPWWTGPDTARMGPSLVIYRNDCDGRTVTHEVRPPR